jgi:excisionase family DNA binding protein
MENRVKHIRQANDADFLTVEEASKELGVKWNAIRNYLYDGRLTTYKFKTLTLIRRSEVEARKARRK